MNYPFTDAELKGVGLQVAILKTHFQLMKNYNYLVAHTKTRQAIIVDPAWQMEKIERAVLEMQVKLSGVLITHSHPDHTNLAVPVADKYGCPIWMSKKEIEVSGFNARQLIGVDTFPWVVGEMLIEPILTPGHTPGCVCYRLGANLFTGDVLFAEGCGMCPDIRAAHAMFDSLQNLKTRLSPETHIYPGHSYGQRPGQTLAQLLRDNIYLQFSDKDTFAAFRLRKNQDIARMFSFS